MSFLLKLWRLPWNQQPWFPTKGWYFNVWHFHVFAIFLYLLAPERALTLTNFSLRHCIRSPLAKSWEP